MPRGRLVTRVAAIGTITSKRQFTIPQRLRAVLGIGPGDKVRLDVRDGKLVVSPVGKDTA